MSGFLRLFNFYINSSIHVALSVAAFTWLSYLEMGGEAELEVLLFVFFSSVLGYNFVKYFGFIAAFKAMKANWLSLILGLSVVSLVLAFYLLIQFNSWTILVVLALALLTFFYATPLAWGKSKIVPIQNLRGFSGLKAFIIAFVWTCTTVLLPVFEGIDVMDETILIILSQRFLWILILMIPFEIRDLKYDHPDLGTIPQVIGIKGSKYLAYVMILALAALELTKSPAFGCFSLISVLMLVLISGFIWGANSKRSSYYSAFWVEGVPIFWLGLVLVFC